mgnify:CR=1 FL=1
MERLSPPSTADNLEGITRRTIVELARTAPLSIDFVERSISRTELYVADEAFLVGTGVQVGGMVFVTMTFAVLGFLSPANRGALLTAMLFLFVLMKAVLLH